MAVNVSIYKAPILQGTGSMTAGSAAVGSFTKANGIPSVARKNVQVTVTSGNSAGMSFETRILSDDGAGNLVLKDPLPFTE